MVDSKTKLIRNREEILLAAEPIIQKVSEKYQGTVYTLDLDIGWKLLKFVSLLKHTAGAFAGINFQLLPFQIEWLLETVAVVRKEDGKRKHRVSMLFIPRKSGKSLTINTKIPTPYGYKLMGDLLEGDVLFDERGKRCKVKGIVEFFDRVTYDVTFSNGEVIGCDENHEWLLSRRGERLRVWETKKIATDYAQKRKYGKKDGIEYIYRLPIAGAYAQNKKQLLIAPYDLGVWLGDGDKAGPVLTLNEYDSSEIIGHMEDEKHWNERNYASDIGRGRITVRNQNKIGGRSTFKRDLITLNLLKNKHIPEIYFLGSYKQRLALLQGLMDTDGTVSIEGKFSFSQKGYGFCKQFVRLLATLGVKSQVTVKNALCKGKRFLNHRVNFHTSDLMPFKLQRQIEKFHRGKIKGTGRAKTLSIIDVKQIENQTTRCIEVDSPSHLFLCGETGIPTRNTELAGALQLYMLFVDKEKGKETYIVASETKQATILFRVCDSMVRQNTFLSNRATIYKGRKSIELQGGDFHDTFSVLTANAETKDGLRPSFMIQDEAHAFKTDDMYQVLSEGMSSREQPLTVIISTAGYNIGGSFHLRYEYAKKVGEGIIDDPSMYSMLFEIPDGMTWHNKEAWIVANPALEYGVTMEYLEDKYRRAQHSGADEISFRCKHLNEFLNVSEIFIPYKRWLDCGQPLTDINSARQLIIGLDLSLVDDFTAVAFLYLLDDNRYHLRTKFFIPQKNLRQREKDLRIPLRSWVMHGHVIATPGDTIDLDYIYNYLQPFLDGDLEVELTYDPYRSTALINRIEAELGFYDNIQVRQGSITLSAPTKYFLDIIKRDEITHDLNPCMDWNVSNVEVLTDSNGNIKPNKSSQNKKIDGVSATINCLTRALAHFEEVGSSGIVFI